MDTVNIFDKRVELYEKYRPGYPLEVISVLENEFGFNPTMDVADIGSGTGKLSKIFVQNENLVFGVEPNSKMRKIAEKNLKGYYNFISVDGRAEATTLADSSVDVITVAQAFHWFDSAKAQIEFRRILRANGYAVIIWNERKDTANPFSKALAKLIKNLKIDKTLLSEESAKEETLKKFFKTKYLKMKFLNNSQLLDFNGLKGRLLSSSYTPLEGEMNKKVLSELKDIFEKYNENGKVKIEYKTKIYTGILS